MAEQRDATWEEPTNTSSSDVVARLVRVLCFDDLTADDAQIVDLGDEGALTIGRANDGGPVGLVRRGHYAIGDRFASSRHAVIRRSEADRAGPVDRISDDGSRNGTFVNGEPLREAHRLLDQDVVEVGHTIFVYVTMERADAARLDAAPLCLGPTRTLCPALARIVQDLEDLAEARESILVLGETGAGKEAVAASVHEWSKRRGALRAVDCGAIPDSLFEATMFGHRRGAFTGAEEARIGEIVRADRGTLFLDEIGNLSPQAQMKLLRVMETGIVQPIGASAPENVDVRWVAATNHPIFEPDSGFREDLLHRLAGYVVRLPPLRRRKQDLGTLIAHLLRELGPGPRAVTVPAGRRLFSSAWPGNIRQLRGVLRTAALLAKTGAIDVQHISLDPSPERPVEPPLAEAKTAEAPTTKKKASAAEIERALADAGGNIVRAAASLGVHPRQLYRWIERYEISLEPFRAGRV